MGGAEFLAWSLAGFLWLSGCVLHVMIAIRRHNALPLVRWWVVLLWPAVMWWALLVAFGKDTPND